MSLRHSGLDMLLEPLHLGPTRGERAGTVEQLIELCINSRVRLPRCMRLAEGPERRVVFHLVGQRSAPAANLHFY